MYGILSILLPRVWVTVHFTFRVSDTIYFTSRARLCDTVHLTSSVLGYYPFYFQGYRILSILLPGYGIMSILLPGLWDTINFTSRVWDTINFTSRDEENCFQIFVCFIFVYFIFVYFCWDICKIGITYTSEHRFEANRKFGGTCSALSLFPTLLSTLRRRTCFHIYTCSLFVCSNFIIAIL